MTDKMIYNLRRNKLLRFHLVFRSDNTNNSFYFLCSSVFRYDFKKIIMYNVFFTLYSFKSIVFNLGIYACNINFSIYILFYF